MEDEGMGKILKREEFKISLEVEVMMVGWNVDEELKHTVKWIIRYASQEI
jgi:hypothetical protein